MASVLKFDQWLSTAGITHSTVVQTVTKFENGSHANTLSTTYVDAGHFITITPKFVTSKILVIFNSGMSLFNSGGGGCAFTIYRNDATNLDAGPSNYGLVYRTGDNGRYGDCTMSILDSPNSIGAVTYRAYQRSLDGTSRPYFSHVNHYIRIWAMEIAQ